MTVQRICSRHGRYVGRSCPKCRTDRDARTKPITRADQLRSSRRWKRVQRAAIARDGYRCTYGLELGDRGAAHYPQGRCPVEDGLSGHHRVPIEAGGEPFELDNVRTVCATHHAALEARDKEARQHE